mgnify:CR=1 FL=1
MIFVKTSKKSRLKYAREHQFTEDLDVCLLLGKMRELFQLDSAVFKSCILKRRSIVTGI